MYRKNPAEWEYSSFAALGKLSQPIISANWYLTLKFYLGFDLDLLVGWPPGHFFRSISTSKSQENFAEHLCLGLHDMYIICMSIQKKIRLRLVSALRVIVKLG